MQVRQLALAASLMLAGAAQAAPVSYAFTGILNGFGSEAYVGRFTYDLAVATPTTTFYDAVWQGYMTVYTGAITELSITVGDDHVSLNAPGNLSVLNFHEADYGVSPGLDVLTFSLLGNNPGTTGSINGTTISNLYLSFYDTNGYIDPADGQPTGAVSPDIDPAQTNTLVPELPYGGYFLGLNFGVTNTVNNINSFTLAPTNPVPEPETWAMFLGGLGLLAWRRRTVR